MMRTRAVPLARVAGVISSLTENLPGNGNLRIDLHTVVIHTDLMRHPAGMQRSPRRAAQRIRAVGVSEIHPVGHERINVGRFEPLVPPRTDRVYALLIGGDDQHISFAGMTGSGNRQSINRIGVRLSKQKCKEP
ncbi:MAG TPA: hypothetical protein VMW72_04275 [Sedimentisphaerales bacterium]|nr:hypothetical protein [Sedimentisphaerales bacterium]